MKKRTINKTLKAVHASLCASITDERVRKLVAENTIITGGCITSMLLQEDVNDYDIYFRTRETVVAVAEYYVKLFKELKQKLVEDKSDEEKEKEEDLMSLLYVDNDVEKDRVRIIAKSSGVASVSETSGYRYFEQVPDEESAETFVKGAFEQLKKQGRSEKYMPVLLTSNAITLSNKIQLVIRFWGEPEEIHENYDFVHVTNYWTSWDQQVVTNTDALECILARELRYNGSLYPICSMIRVRKFIKCGWSVHAGQLLKMAFQINKLDLTNPNVLEEQLTGVDFAYFSEVIDILRKDVNRGKTIDATYLAEVIDRLIGE